MIATARRARGGDGGGARSISGSLSFLFCSVLTETRPPFDSGEGENPLKSSILLPPTIDSDNEQIGRTVPRPTFVLSLAPSELIIRIVLAFETRHDSDGLSRPLCSPLLYWAAIFMTSSSLPRAWSEPRPRYIGYWSPSPPPRPTPSVAVLRPSIWEKRWPRPGA